MIKLDHLAIGVSNLAVSRDWYIDKLGFTVEFEVPDRRTTAVKDDHDFTIFLVEGEPAPRQSHLALWCQVDDVWASFEALGRKGVRFVHGPQKSFWGFGTEMTDPDGYIVRLWDQASMKAAS